MARDNPSRESSQDRHKPQPVNPRGERLEQERPRERERESEIWAEENEKKDCKPGAPDKPAEREPATRQKTRAAGKQTWTTGTRALSPLTEKKTGEADRNDPARRAT